jgi:hypothetical protein
MKVVTVYSVLVAAYQYERKEREWEPNVPIARRLEKT